MSKNNRYAKLILKNIDVLQLKKNKNEKTLAKLEYKINETMKSMK